MKKLFEKHETLFCLALIALYIAVNSFCMQNFGIESLASAVINTLFSLGLLALTFVLGRSSYYGLKKAKNPQKYLYFLPLILISSVNFWNGVSCNGSAVEAVLFVISMLCVGFLEELIFRGFLFRAMCRDNVKTAIVVSSLTFGFGHIVNLLRGAELAETLCQLIYASAIGFCFTAVFYVGKSIIPCIIVHAVVNSTSYFAVTEGMSRIIPLVSTVIITVVSVGYGVYLLRSAKKGTMGSSASSGK